jgi:hypothetical protein
VKEVAEMFVKELKKAPHTFTLKDGKTLRILANEGVTITDDNVSAELEIARDMGIIALIPDSAPIPTPPKKPILRNGGK